MWPIHRPVVINLDDGVHRGCEQQTWTETHPAIVPRSTPFEHTEQRLADIMSGIHDRYLATADDCGTRGDYFAGRTSPAFTHVADAVSALGLIRARGLGFLGPARHCAGCARR